MEADYLMSRSGKKSVGVIRKSRRYSRKKVPLVLLGPAGSFSDSASKYLEKDYQKKYVGSFKELFGLVKNGAHGFVPVRNKIVGSIGAAQNLLNKGRFKVIGKKKIPVTFVLAAKNKILLNEIEVVYCPAIIYAQCTKFIKEFLGGARFPRASESSAVSFKKVSQMGVAFQGTSEKVLKAAKVAAIGPPTAAKVYGLIVLAKNLESKKHDWTEFLLIKCKKDLTKGGAA